MDYFTADGMAGTGTGAGIVGAVRAGVTRKSIGFPVLEAGITTLGAETLGLFAVQGSSTLMGISITSFPFTLVRMIIFSPFSDLFAVISRTTIRHP
jgi:phage head maturation protease